MAVWLLKGPGQRTVLLDAGFYRDEFIRETKPADFHRPSEYSTPWVYRRQV